MNLFIGRNNCGKSNILRAIHEVFPNYLNDPKFRLSSLELHIRTDDEENPFVIGTGIDLPSIDDDWGELQYLKDRCSIEKLPVLWQVLSNRAAEGEGGVLWFDYVGQGREFDRKPWEDAILALDSDSIHGLWRGLLNNSGGHQQIWVDQIIDHLKRPHSFPSRNTVMIPAIRQVAAKGGDSNDFSGLGIIDRLARLQNPDVHNRSDRKKFEKINEFLQYVTENDSASIEVPYERNTINVHMDGRVLPLESMGTGIHEVVILAAASTINEHSLVCMEEPELHLNPVLQKKLAQYLYGETSNQYFIATHSAALMDAENMSIFHVRYQDGQSVVSRVVTASVRAEICDDLGYKPSDLLQSNCIIWVEGPSDRIYLKSWIGALAPELKEGVDFSIMFYGGRLASHLSGLDPTEIVDEFISLRRLNRRSAIVIDSDKRFPQTPINETKSRLVSEFEKGPGFAWVTAGREIENYIPAAVIREAIQYVAPNGVILSDFEKYSDYLEIQLPKGTIGKAPKVAVAKRIVDNSEPDLTVLDLSHKIERLVTFIRESNA